MDHYDAFIPLDGNLTVTNISFLTADFDDGAKLPFIVADSVARLGRLSRRVLR